uniref:Uncharacterized protein n=1 Tax=Glycine max TaxID=3847 RepID=A0A368UMZ1_SOYBN
MHTGMASLTQLHYKVHASTFRRVHSRSQGLLKSGKLSQLQRSAFPSIHINQSCICCTKLTPWESSPVTYAPTDNQSDTFLPQNANIFETLESSKTADSSITNAEGVVETESQPGLQLQVFKWPLWLLGPSVLLATGMVPTLWLPISSIFLGPNIASLLSLIGLDCIFNLVWLVTPVIYESYRVLQLMRGLKLGVELSAPAWVMHTIRGLVCWWVLILGLQLMRVAWFAGLAARARKQQLSSVTSSVNGD